MSNSLRSAIGKDLEEIPDESWNSLSALSGTSILVTGANGFICSYLVDLLAWANEFAFEDSCKIYALDNSWSRRPDRLSHLNGQPYYSQIEHDVARPIELSEQIDWIIHGASIASPMRFRQQPLATLDANIGGARRTLELARKKSAQGIAVLSSSEIYGEPDEKNIPTSEEYWGHPRGHLFRGHSTPERSQIDDQPVPRRVLERRLSLRIDERPKHTLCQPVALEALTHGIDDPVMLDAEFGVTARLQSAILRFGRRRQDLDHQSGRGLDTTLRDVRGIGDDDQVGHEHVSLGQDEIDRRVEDLTQRACLEVGLELPLQPL